MPVSNEISPSLLERVLERLGFDAAPSPDAAGLGELYRAWCRHVPFDNLRKLIHLAAADPGALPGDGPADFFRAWLEHGTGGTCWAGNGALCSLLDALGFEASRGLGTMLVAPDLPPNHGTVIVRIEPRCYLVDASILHHEPLPLLAGTSTIANPAWGVRCEPESGRWKVWFRPMQRTDGLFCRIDGLCTDAADFRRRHEQTRDWSPFNFELHARLVRDDSIVGVARGERVELAPDGSVHCTRLDPRRRQKVLVEELGFSEEISARLPADRPTPPPPGSRSARAAGPADGELR